MGSLLAKLWSSWSHLEELRRIGCLVLDRVLRLQFLFCSVWCMALFATWYENVLHATLVDRGVVRASIRRIKFTICEIVHPLRNYYLLIETTMCCRYRERLTVISMAYSLGSLSKWAGRPFFDSCYYLVIIRA